MSKNKYEPCKCHAARYFRYYYGGARVNRVATMVCRRCNHEWLAPDAVCYAYSVGYKQGQLDVRHAIRQQLGI